MGKFYDIDPETCSIEELKAAIIKCDDAEKYYNTMQLSAKTFINSVYGVFGTSYFNLANTDIAESITLQGQDLIKYSVIQINDYVKNWWNNDYDGHKRIADKMKSIYGDKFKYDEFIAFARNNKVMMDTLQVYGDSVDGKSLITLFDGSKKTIEDMFNESCDSDSNDKIRVKSNHIVKAYDTNNHCISFYPVKYIMRHYTNKNMFRVTSSDDKYIDVTSDHSVIIFRDDDYISVKPTDIKETDKIIISDGANSYIKDIKSILLLGECKNFVYDIEIDTMIKECHNFFANDILVHNTDSVSEDSIVVTKKHPNGISIKEFYDENCKNGLLKSAIIKKKNNEHLKRWRIKTESGKECICDESTNLFVKRGDLEIKIKPNEILDGDSIMCIC